MIIMGAMVLRSRYLLALVLVLPFLATAPVPAQSTEAAIAARLVLKPLYLRGSWGDDKLHFGSAGQPTGSYKVVPFTTAAVNISKIHLSGDRLYLQGKRVGLIFNAAGAITRVALTRKDQLQIEVDTPPSGDFGPALDAIFTTSVADVPAASAGPWQAYAAHHWPAPATDAATAESGSQTVPQRKPLGGREVGSRRRRFSAERTPSSARPRGACTTRVPSMSALPWGRTVCPPTSRSGDRPAWAWTNRLSPR